MQNLKKSHTHRGREWNAKFQAPRKAGFGNVFINGYKLSIRKNNSGLLYNMMIMVNNTFYTWKLIK